MIRYVIGTMVYVKQHKIVLQLVVILVLALLIQIVSFLRMDALIKHVEVFIQIQGYAPSLEPDQI